ncbi:hypothetical protein [Streptomyces luteogriseus]|uniref:hypothetical protein n=1 Tax=Streptomyces luteogriseus TaxID=68233 RepID=UPI0037F6C765
MTEVYNAKKAAPRGQAKAERIARYGARRFEKYAAQRKAGQRDLGPASVAHLESLLSIHLLPLLGSRRMDTFDHKVVEGFLLTLERGGVGLAAQANAFDKPKAILLDADRLGLFDDNPVAGVPLRERQRAVLQQRHRRAVRAADWSGESEDGPPNTGRRWTTRRSTASSSDPSPGARRP